MIRRPPRSTLSSSSAASDVYKRQEYGDSKTQNMECSPRIGKSHFGDYNGKVVRFVGKVKSNNGGVAVLEAPDGGEVTVQNSTPYSTQFVEVLGSVQGNAIAQQSYVDFGDNFHMENYNQMLRLVHGNRVSSLFA
eukprot:TRINITY_DN18114_c0_g1_i3.p1 TRINITY_DN18114_c0_g1~~TRINITY_DN18114_c0_g1_i3.p1  ORF type:complete len:135 (+),score=40.30 TRINITY_DN18114_c0_g1_i3:133-537(+)